jgi:hypothetical protein
LASDLLHNGLLERARGLVGFLEERDEPIALQLTAQRLVHVARQTTLTRVLTRLLHELVILRE